MILSFDEGLNRIPVCPESEMYSYRFQLDVERLRSALRTLTENRIFFVF